MNTQAGTEDHPPDAIDDSGWNWTMEAEVGKRFQPYPRFKNKDDSSCSNDANCSNNAKDTNDSTQKAGMSITSSPSDKYSAPASDGGQTTLEDDRALTSTKAWHMATHTTAGEERPLWCILGPVETNQPDIITLELSVDETEKCYTITPCFPAKHKSDVPRWANSATVSNALAQINTIITKIDPSVCFNVKTKALKSHERETRVGWHVKALNTLLARSPEPVTVTFGEYPVTFGQASGKTSIVPQIYYPVREDVIKSSRRHVLTIDQAKGLYSQLPPDHPSYQSLESEVVSKKAQLDHRAQT
jgi:hypothetical protein